MKNLNYLIITLLLIQIQVVESQVNPKYEMRAIWIATVNNIDWPSKPGLPADDQKREMTELLDLAKEYNLNTVIFQVRPAADAFYMSETEPWSQWLEGEQGKAPEPLYDPLQFMITECRKRGLDIHAWLNPYRAVTDTANITDPAHITNLHPEWFVTYGKTVYFDPGLPHTRDYVASVVSDIVRRYDIDAIHMDDYFYPYRIAKTEFPDDSSFAEYPRGFAGDKRDDWRRDNVNIIIRQLSDSIKAIKPWVEFGISPFGVWRNSDKDSLGSATKAGQTNYDDLFADILLWQKNGWIDYVVPQIYWHIGMKVANYPVLAEWWSRNAWGCNLYIGQAPYRIDRKSSYRQWRSSREIIRQIEINRGYPNIGGSMFFSARHLRRNPLKLRERLVRDHYSTQALPPVNNRIAPIIPHDPSGAVISKSAGILNLSWTESPDVKKYVIYRFRTGRPASISNPSGIVLVTSEREVTIPLTPQSDTENCFYMVTAVSRTNHESNPVYFKPSNLKP